MVRVWRHGPSQSFTCSHYVTLQVKSFHLVLRIPGVQISLAIQAPTKFCGQSADFHISTCCV